MRKIDILRVGNSMTFFNLQIMCVFFSVLDQMTGGRNLEKVIR